MSGEEHIDKKGNKSEKREATGGDAEQGCG